MILTAAQQERLVQLVVGPDTVVLTRGVLYFGNLTAAQIGERLLARPERNR